MEKIKISKYIVSKSIGKDTWIYNCLTSGFVKIHTDYWFQLKDMIKSKNTLDINDVNTALIKTGILIKEDIDELMQYKYFYYSEMFQNIGLSLSIAPTMKCNFGCFYCFEEGNKNSGTMTEAIEENLIKFISNHKCQDINITWFGGEPLLAFDRILSISRKLHASGVKFSSDIITNGSLLTDSVIENLPILNLNYIQITLDGVAKDHDKRRFFKNGTPSFNLIVQNIENLLKKTSIPISIKVTVDHANSTAYGDVVSFFRERFHQWVIQNRIAISHNFVKNRTDFDKTGSCFSTTDLLNEYLKSFKGESGACAQPSLPDLAKPCMYRCKESLAIDSDGYIYRCLEHLGLPAAKVGDLSKGILSNTQMARTTFEDNPFDSSECTNCCVFPICAGGCPIDRLNKKKGKKIDYCSSYKDNLAELLPYFYQYQYSAK